jgi:hypothetical protein
VVSFQGSEYVLHINFDKIKAEVDKIQSVDKEVLKSIRCFVDSLQETSARIEPTLSKETMDEKELWEDYKQLQREKLAVLDLSHEWDYIDETVRQVNSRLDFLVKDALEELKDHIGVLSESHRAHIDILEIYNTRKIEVLALVLTATISYLAVWEFFVRDIIAGTKFPADLSPFLNYTLVVLTLLPIFIIVTWAWIRRKTYF